jgi:hypothetical protein
MIESADVGSLSTVDIKWIETVGAVAIGAIIGSAPAAWSIRSENRRFDASGIAAFEAYEAEQLRRCLVPMAQCISTWAYVAAHTFSPLPENPDARFARLAKLVADSNTQFEERMGEILTNPRATPFQQRYEDASREWSRFQKCRIDFAWTDDTDPIYRNIVEVLNTYSKWFSSDAKSAISALSAPASTKRRKVQPEWRGDFSFLNDKDQMSDSVKKANTRRFMFWR